MRNNLRTITFGIGRKVKKGWGHELQIVNHHPEMASNPREDFPLGYSGKLLVYEKAGAVSSMHFHTVKDETFYVAQGKFRLQYFDPKTADMLTKELNPNDVVSIPPTNPHQLICLEAGYIVEFASTDHEWDNFRVAKGDSQKKS